MSTPSKSKAIATPPLNNSKLNENLGVEFQAGKEEGIRVESDRIKKGMDERYRKLVDSLSKEVNIAIRYELKLQIDELQEVYRILFMNGEE